MISLWLIWLDRWRGWRNVSVNRRIFAAMITVGAFTLVVKAIGILRQLVIADQFGTSDALDAFLIAFLVPSFAVNVVAGSFNAAFMPTYIQIRAEQNREAAQRLFSSVTVGSTILIVVISGLLALLSPYIISVIGSGFSPDKQALTRSIFFVVLPVLVISSLATIWASILNAGERFVLAALAPIMTPVVTVIALLAMGTLWGIYALAIGTVGGFFLEAVLLAWGLRREHFSLVPRWYGMDPAARQVAKQYAPMAAGALLMSSTDLVDQSMAAMLGPGSVSALSYGSKVVALIIGMGSIALGTAVFPYFSRMVAEKDWEGIRCTLKTYTGLILLVTVPLTIVLFRFSEPIVMLLFARGAFSTGDTLLVGRVQSLYLLQIPFYVLSIMGVRLLSALKKNQILMVISGINLIANIIGNYLFMSYLGVAGISLSTSVVYLISVISVFLSLNFQLRKHASSE